MKTVLSIAGTDPTGGAGIQTDLKTIEAHGLYGMAAITVVIAQNTTGVFGMQAVSPELVAQQIDCVFEDIRPDAVKLGMLYSADIIHAVADRLRAHHAKNVVLDPVMISSSGHALSKPDAMQALQEEIFPLCTLVTPNLHETARSAAAPSSRGQRWSRRRRKSQPKRAAVCWSKGGAPCRPAADDLLYADGQMPLAPCAAHRQPQYPRHGCTLSSAIACSLAQGVSLLGSVKRAKRYLTACIQFGLDLGHGSGPLQHKVEWSE